MSLTARETLSSQHAIMLSPPKSPMHEQPIKQRPHASDTVKYRRKEVVDGDVERTYESLRRRRQSSQDDTGAYRQQPIKSTTESRGQALQAAMELPSSVLIVQGLRRYLNSDEPLYDDLRREQRVQLQREFLKEVGVVEYGCDTVHRQKVNFPPSPPATPKGKNVVPVEVDASDERRFCECCRTHCV